MIYVYIHYVVDTSPADVNPRELHLRMRPRWLLPLAPHPHLEESYSIRKDTTAKKLHKAIQTAAYQKATLFSYIVSLE